MATDVVHQLDQLFLNLLKQVFEFTEQTHAVPRALSNFGALTWNRFLDLSKEEIETDEDFSSVSKSDKKQLKQLLQCGEQHFVNSGSTKIITYAEYKAFRRGKIKKSDLGLEPKKKKATRLDDFPVPYSGQFAHSIQNREVTQNVLDEIRAGMSDERVLKFLKACANQNRNEEDLRDPCYPFMVSETWNREELGRLLREKQNVVLRNIRDLNNARAPLVITVVAGYGNGKTHFLKIAPELVGQESLYITYNQGQNLKSDTAETGKALLVRIIFQAFGTGSVGAANFLTSPEGTKLLSLWDDNYLLDIAAGYLVQKFGDTGSFMICVDELRKVEDGRTLATSDILSTLGALTRKVFQLKSQLQCTIIVSALDDVGIETYSSSNRPVESMQLPIPDRTAVEFVANKLELPTAQLWKVVVVSGSHFRSLVTSVRVLMEGNTHVDIERLVNLTYDRLGLKLNDDVSREIKEYTKLMMDTGDSTRPPASVKLLCSFDNTIPPILIYTAYRKTSIVEEEFAHKYVLNIFHDGIANDAFDQLELWARNYDLLRSIWNLRVIPQSMDVVVPNYREVKRWYKQLRLPKMAKLSGEGILKVIGKKVQWSGLQPEYGVYYHPGLSNHPWIDRFFLAETEGPDRTMEFCLVLYQDKINSAGFSDSVKHLNFATTLLKEKLQLPILCIANVIGASDKAKKQEDFEHPYILVRDNQLHQFYTPNFAPAMRFLRTRYRDKGSKQIASATAMRNHMM